MFSGNASLGVMGVKDVTGVKDVIGVTDVTGVTGVTAKPVTSIVIIVPIGYWPPRCLRFFWNYEKIE